MKKLMLGAMSAFNMFCCHAVADIPAEEMLVIDSELADYDGEKITLKGNVVIEHALGVFSANQIVLFSSPGKKGPKDKGPFGLLQMDDHVKLAFKDGGQLCCAKADLDYRALAGSFFSNENQEYVVYTESCCGKKKENAPDVPLVVKSRRMAVRLAPGEQGGGKLPRNSISEITADDQVTVNYNNDFFVSADQAVYQRDVAVSDAATAFALPGLITMRAATAGGLCQVSDREGDLIKATEICIDTIKRQLSFAKPKGALHAIAEKQHLGRIDFFANTMLWDEPAGMLTLYDDVEINQSGIGKIATAKEMRFYQDIIAKNKTLKAIETLCDTVLTYHDEDKNLCHTLTCSGPVKVDHEKMETRLLALRDAQGKVAEDKQVHFEDARGEIYADRVLIKYTLAGRTLAISKIVLLGNVKVINRLVSADDEAKTVLQYVLADRVDFNPQNNEMLFKAISKGHRVLFFDKSNSLQLSAPAVKIIRDKATKKDSIKGTGDVRFSFIESEFEQLRQRFALDKLKK